MKMLVLSVLHVSSDSPSTSIFYMFVKQIAMALLVVHYINHLLYVGFSTHQCYLLLVLILSRNTVVLRT